MTTKTKNKNKTLKEPIQECAHNCMLCPITLYKEIRADSDCQPDQRILFMLRLLFFFMTNNQKNYEPCWSASALHDTRALMAG